MLNELTTMVRFRRGHFRLESGYHSDVWCQLDGLFDQPDKLRPFVRELAERLSIHRLDAMCGPMIGGAKLATLLASEMAIDCFVTEREAAAEGSGLFLVRYSIPQERRAALHGRRVAVVDDAISAGSAVRATCDDLIACGAQPVALGAVFIFGRMADQFAASRKLALVGLVQTEFNLWKPEECPLCQAGGNAKTLSERSTPDKN